ncbi:MAG: FAD-dependent oxidoreductase [Deltaproteobacteria bacterium]|nr:FAD-dependent oxidoreductase [Deltaproteobacteria bacterium]
MPPTAAPSQRVDVAVIGGGLGGLGAALALAERGLKVTLLESLRYPGGCAGTFTRQGYRFDAGATLSAGFGARQPFRRWLDRYGLPLALTPLDPVVRLRADGLSLNVPSDRGELLRRLCALPGAPVEGLRRFFEYQARVAAPLWALFDDTDLLPPLSARALLAHAGRAARYAPLLTCAGRPLSALLDRFGLTGFEPLRLYLDATCQITAQCGLRDVEAPVALAALDYYAQGVAHVEGGLGELSWALRDAVVAAGGEVRLSARARALAPAPGGWRVSARGGDLEARAVVANLLPSAVEGLLREGGAPAPLSPWARRAQGAVEDGWGAVMLYLVSEEGAGGEAGAAGEACEAEHWQLIGDAAAPLMEGNHVFCSVSGARELTRAPRGSRVLTLSTHVPMRRLLALSDADRGAYVQRVQRDMRALFAARCPRWSAGVYVALTASPRTFERFTGRPRGYVGGPPRRAGLRQYLQMSPRPAAPGLYLVGDSHFPGQSALAAAVGGERVAARLARELR